ncbi:MAG: DUF1249 domain-containing protein [Halieaceae bacterium]|nr:DUF1249 domain-containing protein [Halieaceae bacterium]
MSGPSLKYSVDIAALHATCESNYARLLQLFPDYETANFREFLLGTGERVRIDVVERCRYTTLLKICQQGGEGWLIPPRFDLRAYHDARMVEVTAFQSQRRVEARYEYPNAGMHARDEKAQQNIFLAEWLSHCIEQGLSPLDLRPSVTGTADAS